MSRQADNKLVLRVQIFYIEGFFMMMNGMKTPINSFCCPRCPEMNIFRSMLGGERPDNDAKLLGLNTIKHFHINIIPLNGGSKLTMSTDNRSSIERHLNKYDGKHMIIELISPIRLYHYDDNFSDKNDISNIAFGVNFIYVNEQYLNDQKLEQYSILTQRHLRLLILSFYDEEIINLLDDYSEIDGYIIKQINEDDNIDIYLKDKLPFIPIRGEYHETVINDISETNFSDINILTKYKITQYYIDIRRGIYS